MTITVSLPTESLTIGEPNELRVQSVYLGRDKIGSIQAHRLPRWNGSKTVAEIEALGELPEIYSGYNAYNDGGLINDNLRRFHSVEAGALAVLAAWTDHKLKLAA